MKFLPDNNFLVSLVVSICLGALIGLIRQWSNHEAQDDKSAFGLGGVRTYTLWAMLGCVSAYPGSGQAPIMFIVAVILIGTHQLISTYRLNSTGRTGGTTFASTILTMFTGALVYWGQRETAVVLAAATMVLLGVKQPIHEWTRAFRSQDIRATLQFVAVTGVILPLVPNRHFGPFEAFNPFSIWLMVVLISGLGFAGYIAMRILGARVGVLLTSLLGGIASSTATTLAFSRQSKAAPGLSASCSLGVITACNVMLPRLIIVIAAFDMSLATHLIVPFLCMLVPGILFTVWIWFFRHPDQDQVDTPELTNPLSLTTALKFGLLYGGIGFLTKVITQLDLSQFGLLPLGFVSGLTNMDAISLSVIDTMDSGLITVTLAAQVIVVAAIGNSLLKAGLAISLGSPNLRRDVGVVLGFTALAGIGSYWLV